MDILGITVYQKKKNCENIYILDEVNRVRELQRKYL